MNILENPWRGRGLPDESGMAAGDIETDVRAARSLFAACPVADVTPLIGHDGVAKVLGIAGLYLKDERQRMDLGSFKALGAAHAIAKLAAARADTGDSDAMANVLDGETFVCASAGNHGLSVAAGAGLFGAKAVVHLAETVPEDFAVRLRGKGAEVVRAGADYEASMAAAMKAAKDKGWRLLSDSSWPSYSEPARDVMEGYLIMAHEVADQMEKPPTHIFLQAGVGGLAAACAAAARSCWGVDVAIVVVEPETAPALFASIEAGRAVNTEGPISTMGRLDCKTPSHLALKYLAREADFFMKLSDEAVGETVKLLTRNGIATSPSGGAGVSGVHHIGGYSGNIRLDESSRVLCYISEKSEEG